VVGYHLFTASFLSIYVSSVLVIQTAEEETGDGSIPGVRDVQPTVLPLLPWEMESARDRKCTPPEGIPSACCLGSSSTGRMVSFRSDLCNNTDVYDRVQNYTESYLQGLALPDSYATQPCDLCQIVDQLIMHNFTLTFQGDSLTRQTVVGLECELRRRGYQVQVNRARWAKRPKHSPKGRGRKFGITDTVDLRVSLLSDQVKGTISSILHVPGAVGRIQYYAIYRPFPDMIEASQIVDNSVILVFDHGLHYTPFESYYFGEDTTALLQTFKGKNLKLLAWRETSSQHWNATGGHYSSRLVSIRDGCVPMPRDGREGFRWPILRTCAERVGMTVLNALAANFSSQPVSRSDHELVILPFRDFTSELHYLHPNECSHFCSTPHLWLPIWRSLRLAMDRALANTDASSNS
jgi:hypothetical protein